MARNWTPEQKSAIDTRDKSLLVSAAAGSGKTATLTQRIIESILDENDPIDINRILVVTFTKAAVGELRERISAAIEARLAERPGDERLEKQLYLLPGARIMTIDAFCNDCLKSFPDAAGISPGYRIADEAEIMIAAREIFDGITESIMRGELADEVSAEEFDTLTDCLVDTKRLADVFDVFRKAYTTLRATKDGTETFAKMAAAYDPEKFTSPDSTVFGRYIMKKERETFLWRAQLFEKLASMLADEGDSALGYADTSLSDAEVYTRVAGSETYEQMKSALDNLEFAKLPSVKTDEKTPLMLLFKNARDREKDKIRSEKERFFTYSSAQWADAFGILFPILRTFHKVLSLFDAALGEYKKKHGLFDYTDIERLAYAALVKDGEPTELALGMREEFLAVYIDEYQDVNDLQNSIFEAISKPDNRFSVGDIKQSIYGFRSANPEIFAAAKRAYPRLENAADSPAASLFMSTNFRSSRGVIDFVNLVFDKMFGAFAESIDYSKADRLSPGRPPLGASYDAKPEICIVKKLGEKYAEQIDEVLEEEDTEPLLPRVVAEKIREILDTGRREDGSEVKPSDIAIILRSMKGRSEKYVSALKELGIPTRTSGKKSFFLNSDVLLALCLFNTIDNPLRDVYLTGLLRSPIFEFTADELVKIRSKDKTAPFYRALRAYVDGHPDFKKGVLFFEKLEKWREIAEGMRTDRLIRLLFRETGLLALAEEHGEKENLIRLYEYARSFEGGGFGGLRSFIAYINNVIADGEKFDCNIESTEDNAVTVISAHSSKGLEYPIVFLADAHKQIRCLETKEKLLYSTGFGAALRHRTPLGLALVDNPMMSAVSERMREANFEEELRILYVALTRARERLYVVGAYAEESAAEYLEKIYLSSLVPSPPAIRRLTSHLDLVLSATGETPLSPEQFLASSKDITELMVVLGAESSDTLGDVREELIYEEEDPDEAIAVIELKNELCRRFEYKYHSPHLTELPEKMSVSALYPTVLDGTEDEEVYSATQKSEKKRFGTKKHTVPEFVTASKETESKRRGIATHMFLQFCDLDGLERNGAEGELRRLSESGYISKEEAARVRLGEIEAFRASALFRRMKEAKKLYREFRFNTALPAELFTEEDEKKDAVRGRRILVQGVIDCIMENPDGTLSVVDYKTDRLTPEELADGSLAEKRLRDAHESQLFYYCLAASEIFGAAPVSAEVYSLHLGRCVDVMKG